MFWIQVLFILGIIAYLIFIIGAALTGHGISISYPFFRYWIDAHTGPVFYESKPFSFCGILSIHIAALISCIYGLFEISATRRYYSDEE